MGTSLFSQLDLGKRSLSAQQAGMAVAGHNIANIHNDSYSRQRVDLESQHPKNSRFGAGVDLVAVGRITDRFLTERLIGEQARGGALALRQETLRRLEDLFNDSEGLGLREPLNQFWASWGRLANEPESEIFRREVLTGGNTLANRFQGITEDLTNIRRELNGRIALEVDRVNQLAQALATQNALVQQGERGRGETNDLRDAREETLRELSRLIKIEWLEDDKYLVNVAIGNGWPLVQGRRVNRLETSFENSETGFFSLRGIDPKGISRDLTATMRGGILKELLTLRDETLVGFSERVNQLASELAFSVNRVHATGTGINSTFDTLNSSFALKSDAITRPLPFVKNGTFRIQMVDDDNEFLQSYQIPIRAGSDTIGDIVARINQVVADPGAFEAVLNADGSVTLASRGPNRFILGDDDTDFAVVMGFNNFFENLEGGRDLRVNERLLRNPNHISTGHNLLPGDNGVALSVHQLQFEPSMQGKSITFDEFYNGITAELGLTLNRAGTEKRNQDLVLDQFKKLRDEVSSVNMDEEVADMVRFQRGFDAAAKFITTIDEMTRTIINM